MPTRGVTAGTWWVPGREFRLWREKAEIVNPIPSPNEPGRHPDPVAASGRFRFPLVRRSRLDKVERQFKGACRELRRVEAIRAEAEVALQLIASHPHGGLLCNIARAKLERLLLGATDASA